MCAAFCIWEAKGGRRSFRHLSLVAVLIGWPEGEVASVVDGYIAKDVPYLSLALTDRQYAEFLAVVGMASETNALATALQIPVDPEFTVE